MKWPKDQPFDVEKQTILAGYVGSHSHGTYVKPKDGGIDDKDIMGIYVPPKSFYLGLNKHEHIDCWVDEYDIVMYEAKKFVNLLLKNNPNVIGMLWLDDNLYVKKTKSGQLLIDNRELFSSKLAYKSFTGYAYAQLKKMRGSEFKGYMGDKRRKLVEKHGYDTKNAAHLIRLLRMGIEFLASGELNVMRHDASQLIDIKQGKYKLEEIQAMADKLFPMAEEALIHSKLPSKPDYKKANELLIQIVEENMNV